MVRKVAVQIIKMVLVLSLVVFVVTPIRPAKYFLIVTGAALLFLVCLFLLKQLVGEDTGDRLTTFLVKKFSRKSTAEQAHEAVNPKSKI
jgi:hypothetical protein